MTSLNHASDAARVTQIRGNHGNYPPAKDCAKKLLAAALQGEVETDWTEVRRLALSPAYQNWPQVKALIDEQAKALQIGSPCDSLE